MMKHCFQLLVLVIVTWSFSVLTETNPSAASDVVAAAAVAVAVVVFIVAAAAADDAAVDSETKA